MSQDGLQIARKGSSQGQKTKARCVITDYHGAMYMHMRLHLVAETVNYTFHERSSILPIFIHFGMQIFKSVVKFYLVCILSFRAKTFIPSKSATKLLKDTCGQSCTKS